MNRYNDWNEKLLGLSYAEESLRVSEELVEEREVEVDEDLCMDVVCLECGAKFTASTDCDECEVCGGSDLDLE